MTDLDLLVRFEDEALAGLSPATVSTRQGAALRFAGWLSPRSLLEATTGDVGAWLDQLAVSADTRGARTGQLHHLYNWLLNEGLVDRDPVAPLVHVRRPIAAGDFPDLQRGYLIAQERKGLKRSSIEARARTMRLLQDWMAPKSMVDANAQDIELWLDARRIGPKTRYAIISHLHMFYRWAVRQGHVAADPTEDIDRPRIPQNVPRPISDDNLALALDRADPVCRAILSLAAYAGLRAQEIAGVRREDILEHLAEPMLIVSKPKGHKERTVPLHPKVWAALNVGILPRTGPVFTGLNGTQWPAWRVSHLANDHLGALQIPSTLHSLRHYFATKVYGVSLDLRLTQELLGHSSPTTTAIYTQYAKGRASEVVAAL